MKTYTVELTDTEIALISYCLGCYAENHINESSKIISKLYRAIKICEVINNIINKGEKE